MRDWPSRQSPQLLHETGPSRILRSVWRELFKSYCAFLLVQLYDAGRPFFFLCLVLLFHKTQEQMMKKKNGEEEKENNKKKK